MSVNATVHNRTYIAQPSARLSDCLAPLFFFFFPFSLRGLNTLPDIKGTSCRWWWIRPHKLWDKLLLLTTPTPASQVVTCCLLSIKVAVIFGNSYCVVWRVNLTLSSTNQSLFPAELDKQRTYRLDDTTVHCQTPMYCIYTWILYGLMAQSGGGGKSWTET